MHIQEVVENAHIKASPPYLHTCQHSGDVDETIKHLSIQHTLPSVPELLTNGWNGRYNLSQLQFVQDGCFTCCVQTHCRTER